MKNCSKINNCPITDSTSKIMYADLGMLPLVNNLCNSKDESLNCDVYPLQVNFYPESTLSALSYAVSGKLLFDNYLFKSNVNIPYINHCKAMFNYITNKIELSDNDLIIDIGGNDGTLLSTFKSYSPISLEYLNIDPSRNLATESEAKGIPVLNKFFSYETSKLVKKKAKVITSTNVFQHLKDIVSFVSGIQNILDDNGLWILEFPYWIHDLETNQFDQIYHEHVYYYSVTSLKTLFESHGLKIIDIEKQTIHGGTLRLTIAVDNARYTPSKIIHEYIKKEKHYDINYYTKWYNGIEQHLINCKNLLTVIKGKQPNVKIASFGAAAKGCIFLNVAKINYKDIEYIIDDTDVKQGKFMPGTGLEIISRDNANLDDIDYIIILAHNFADYIIESFKDTYKGKFIIFLPTIKII